MSGTASRLAPSPDALATRVGEEIVLVHLKTDRIFVLNRTGVRIWELIAEGCDDAELRRRVGAEFEVGGDVLDREVGELIASLERERLITAGPGR
jgi:hypothetical protein